MRLFRKICILSLCLVLAGIPVYTFAKSYFVGGQVSGGGGTVSWADWDETSESDFASSTRWVCFFENPSNGGDETAHGGGLTGADLVATQIGTVAGATGSPPYRQLDHVDDRFQMTLNAIDTMLTNKTAWTIIIKFADLQGSSTGEGLFYFGISSGNQAYIEIKTGGLSWHIHNNGSGDLNGGTYPAAPGPSGIAYIAIWCDGSTNVRCGWTSTKPTKYSDFNVANVKTGSATCNFSGSWSTYSNLFSYGTGSVCNAKVYYVILASECLIDNAS